MKAAASIFLLELTPPYIDLEIMNLRFVSFSDNVECISRLPDA